MPVNLSKARFGDTKPTRALDLIFVQPDNAMSKRLDKNGKPSYCPDVFVNPESPMAQGQVTLNLRDAKDDQGRHDNGIWFTSDQMDAMIEAAGDNKTRVKKQDGTEYATAYAVKANVMLKVDPAAEKRAKAEAVASGTEFDPDKVAEKYWQPNPKTFAASSLPVGTDPRGRMIAVVKATAEAAAKDAKDATRAASAKDAKGAEPELS